ncbi:MAG: dTDP-4-dehydrorhamnose 3,5-epimerase [Fibromonadaceae bacterium]|jgi:dTDP-4-dehydrorhamnose 3,5-epimerase|nr:dTDP-4-dehydrorhamnose 3,5-epimerase [Fibromonadaceae bacterium]
MQFEATHIPGAFVIKQDPFIDIRGSFSRIFCDREFFKHGIEAKFVQSNLCTNKLKGTLRGLHAQLLEYAEDKIVICSRGRIYDVCVDMRICSPTYGQYFGAELSENNGKMLFIPKGCAHGYLTLEDNCQLVYFMSDYYVPNSSIGYRYDEPLFSIKWPLPKPFIISEQDLSWQYIQIKEKLNDSL